MPVQFSKRLPWCRKGNAYDRALQGVPKDQLLDLTLANPTQAELTGLPVLPTLDLATEYHPDPQGNYAARQAIADWYAEKSLQINPDHLMITPGTSVGYEWLFKLLADPGCSILAPTPAYPLFEDLITLEGLRLRSFLCEYDTTWKIDRKSLETAWLPSCRGVLWVNPCNPTGQTAAPADQDALVSMNCPLIIDEVFADYTIPKPFQNSFVGYEDTLNFVLSGLSKVMGLPQLKISWILVQGPARERESVLQKLRWIADTYLAVPEPMQAMVPELLRCQTAAGNVIRERLQQNRQALVDSGLCTLNSDGGWYAVLRDPQERDDEKLALELIRDASVAVHPGYFYDIQLQGTLVLSLLPAPKRFQSGVARIQAWLGKMP